MWRVLSVVEQMSTSLNDASRYLADALGAIDAEMSSLQTRLHADAHNLRTSIAGADLSDEDRAVLLATLSRVENTADAVAAFAHHRRHEPADHRESDAHSGNAT
jgi:uncharacterized membrane protein